MAGTVGGDTLAPGGGRTALALVAAPIALLGGTLLTYRPWLDGPFLPLVAAVLLAGAATALGVTLGQRRGWPCPALFLLALGLVLPLPVVRATRYLNRQATLGTELTSPREYGQAVEPALTRGASLQILPGELVVRAPAGSTGSLEVRLPDGAPGGWRLPRALVTGQHPRVEERLTWSASIERDQVYFVLVDSEPLLIQTTAWGLLITLRPAGGRPQEQSVALPLEGGAIRTWSLRRHAGRVVLDHGGAEVWAAPDPGPFRYLRLGETRSDPEHGGTLRLAELQFVRSLN